MVDVSILNKSPKLSKLPHILPIPRVIINLIPINVTNIHVANTSASCIYIFSVRGKVRHVAALWEMAAFLQSEAYQQLELLLAGTDTQDLLDMIMSIIRCTIGMLATQSV